MSNASPFRQSRPDEHATPGAGLLESLVTESARRAGFWSAVALPFVLLGLVVTGEAAEQVPLFAALLLANVLALRLGHAHNRD